MQFRLSVKSFTRYSWNKNLQIFAHEIDYISLLCIADGYLNYFNYLNLEMQQNDIW